MSAETRKILEMLADKKITAEEADKLLEKLSAQPAQEARPEQAGGSKPRFMRIVVDKPGEKQVNVRMPLTFMRTGTHFLAVLPPRVREKLAEHGIDVDGTGAMNPEEWAKAIESMDIDVEGGNGKKVRIFCE